MTPDLLAFFEHYRDAFNALDGDRVAALYAEPSAISQQGCVTHWPDRAAVAANMRALCRLYRDRGFEQAAFVLHQALPLGEHDAVVDLRWRIGWAGGEPPWHFGTAYHVTRTADGWRVLLCTAHDEGRRWQEEAPLSSPASPVTPAMTSARAGTTHWRIEPLVDATDADWLRLRLALWPDSTPAEHRAEMAACTAEPARHAQFVARETGGAAIGLAEASLRIDHVPGAQTSPVAFLEGLYVEPWARAQGVARALVAAVADWARRCGCSELASDTPLDNTLSQHVHCRLGFAETERIVCFCQTLPPSP
jgi:aminoglycoside 6'-N-acetyltransferase I